MHIRSFDAFLLAFCPVTDVWLRHVAVAVKPESPAGATLLCWLYLICSRCRPCVCLVAESVALLALDH